VSIKIITEPSVYLLGKQVLVQDELTRFLEDHEFENWSTDSPSDSETLCEVAARTCYQSFKGGRNHADHLRHLLEVKHGSCVEHAVWNLLVTGVSRSLTHELIRHRAGTGYSQLSQRYVDESVAEYVCPDIIAEDPELHEIWLESLNQSHAAYVKLANKLNEKLIKKYRMQYLKSGAHGIMAIGNLDDLQPSGETKTAIRKEARQAARSVLPNATETKIFVTLNARAARHFVEQRGSKHAEPEIRKLANAILDVLAKDAPNLFGDYERIPLPDGTYEINTKYPKV
jgi:thymidylate synthase (FAD)